MRARSTVASTAPLCLAIAAKAPAKMKIHTMYSTFEDPASFEKISIFCEILFPFNVNAAHIDAIIKATLIGIL